MEFLSGAMLWGAVAGAIPIVLHLVGRSQPVVHRFAALRFIIKSHRRTSRTLRLKNVLLLLLRMGVIVLLAFAMARPTWPWRTAVGAGLGAHQGDVVLILDGSMSMGFKARNDTRFERAQRQALAWIDRLSADSRVALILATDNAERIQGRLTLDHQKVRELIKRTQVTGQGLNVKRALGAARVIFEREGKRQLPRRIIFFTDLQRNAYKSFPGSLQESSQQNGGEVPLTVVDVGKKNALNGAILSVHLPGKSVPRETSVTLLAKVRPADPEHAFTLDFYVDGLKAAQRQIKPNGMEEFDVRIAFPSGKPGLHSGRLVLVETDGLAMDQERSLTYRAGRPPRALIVERPGDGSERSSSYFLNASLGTHSASLISGLKVTVAGKKLLTPAQLAQFQVVVLADPGPLSIAAWDNLRRFVTEGGGLMIWAGLHTDPLELRRYGFSELEGEKNLLPGRMGKRIRLAKGKALSIQVARPDHVLLARMTPALRSLLSNVRIQSYVTNEFIAMDVDSEVILTLSDGTPLLTEKTFGKGRVLLWAMGPDRASSNLPALGEVFVTLNLDACRALVGRAEDAFVRIGKPLRLTIPNPPKDRTVMWNRPGKGPLIPLTVEGDGAKEVGETLVSDPSALGLAEPSAKATLLIPSIQKLGIHRLVWKTGKSGVKNALMVAVNPDASESDLIRVTRKDLIQKLKPIGGQVVGHVSRIRVAQATSRTGRELLLPLLMGVLLFLILESFLANRLYRQVRESDGA